MKLSTTDTTGRQVLLSILLASLMITSGCAGFLSDGGNSGATETPTTASTTPTQNSSDTTTGTDLRSVAIPDNGSVTVEGELDSGDPKNGGKYYEPIQVATVEDATVNISMETEGPSPELRVINPDGNVSAIVSSENGSDTGFHFGTFNQTGRYTLEASSVERNATFNYTLTIERAERPERDSDGGVFSGEPSEWSEVERYLFASWSYSRVVTAYTDRSDTRTLAEVPTNLTRGVRNGDLYANATGDYAVITYEMPADYSFTQRNELDVAFQLSYRALLNQTRATPNSGMNESWVPEIIFYRGVDSETGEVVRTTFYTKEWADQYLTGELTGTESSGNYYSTERWGPASDTYADEDFDQVTDEGFPQVYHNYTYPDNSTLAERYGL